VVPVYVIVVGVVALLLFVALLYYIKRAADLNKDTLKLSRDLCTEAQDKGDTATVQKCVQALSDERRAASDAIADAVGPALAQAAKWGTIGLGVVAAVYLLPALVPRVVKAGRAAKEARA
jgi:hypothetical protein